MEYHWSQSNGPTTTRSRANILCAWKRTLGSRVCDIKDLLEYVVQH